MLVLLLCLKLLHKQYYFTIERKKKSTLGVFDNLHFQRVTKINLLQKIFLLKFEKFNLKSRTINDYNFNMAWYLEGKKLLFNSKNNY